MKPLGEGTAFHYFHSAIYLAVIALYESII